MPKKSVELSLTQHIERITASSGENDSIKTVFTTLDTHLRMMYDSGLLSQPQDWLHPNGQSLLTTPRLNPQGALNVLLQSRSDDQNPAVDFGFTSRDAAGLRTISLMQPNSVPKDQRVTAVDHIVSNSEAPFTSANFAVNLGAFSLRLRINSWGEESGIRTGPNGPVRALSAYQFGDRTYADVSEAFDPTGKTKSINLPGPHRLRIQAMQNDTGIMVNGLPNTQLFLPFSALRCSPVMQEAVRAFVILTESQRALP